jgi:hypothetical protein
MSNFVIFGLPRSGSSLLGALLAEHPAIHFDTEILHRRFWPLWQRPFYWVWHRYPDPYLAYRCWRTGKPVYGVKLFTHHVQSIGAVLTRLYQHHWQILHIWRRDLFAQTLSLLVAARTDRYNGYHADAAPRLVIDPPLFLQTLKQRARDLQTNQARLAGLNHLNLIYEDDLEVESGWPATLQRVYAYLNLAAVEVHTAYPHTWPQPYAEMVLNYAELQNCYQTQFNNPQ